MNQNKWYSLDRPDDVDSPALLVYPERIRRNINEMIRITGDAARLVVHVKTHKMPAVTKMQMAAGICRFKCATIAEAEMLAASGAKNILLAYQLNYPKALRLLKLIERYPDCHFASLVDNPQSAELLNKLLLESDQTSTVYIDIDDGMHRTGITPDKDIATFYSFISSLSNIQCAGLHIYDGHLRIRDFEKRKRQAQADYAPVKKVIQQIEDAGFPLPEVIAGGSLSFPIHAMNPEVLCSPGTNIFWDTGYANLLPEQDFLWAAVLLTRVISKPVSGTVTTDLGHKSLAPENPIDRRISFLNLDGYEVISQSEEHLMMKVTPETWERLQIGDELYGIPHHICPTVASYDEVQVVENGKITGQWPVTARKRKITV